MNIQEMLILSFVKSQGGRFSDQLEQVLKNRGGEESVKYIPDLSTKIRPELKKFYIAIPVKNLGISASKVYLMTVNLLVQVPAELQLTFRAGINHKTKEKQWQANWQEPSTGVKILFVIDRSDEGKISQPGTWLVSVGNVVAPLMNGRAIMTVILVREANEMTKIAV
jgi:hypothetical protein